MGTDLMMPQTFAELDRWAQRAAATELVPKDFRGKPDAILVAVQYGMEIGLTIGQSLQSIAVINGKPTLWGDALLALVMARPECEDVIEEPEIDQTGNIIGYVCTAKRKGKQPRVARFTVEDAKRAKLWEKRGKEGQDTPWTTYPQRMLQMRARGFALRDAFPDVLRGVAMREEVEDYQVIDHAPLQKKITREQAKELEALLNETNTDSNSFLVGMVTDCTSLEDVPAREFTRLVNMLKQKKQKMEKPAP